LALFTSKAIPSLKKGTAFNFEQLSQQIGAEFSKIGTGASSSSSIPDAEKNFPNIGPEFSSNNSPFDNQFPSDSFPDANSPFDNNFPSNPNYPFDDNVPSFGDQLSSNTQQSSNSASDLFNNQGNIPDFNDPNSFDNQFSNSINNLFNDNDLPKNIPSLDLNPNDDDLQSNFGEPVLGVSYYFGWITILFEIIVLALHSIAYKNILKNSSQSDTITMT